MNELIKARKIINEVDREMVRLFERRMDAAKLVAAYKQENGIPIDDFGRENEIIQKNVGLIQNEEYTAYYVNFLKNTIKLSKDMQHKLLEGMKVGFSGVPGAFAGLAAQKIFPDATCVPFADFMTAYKACENGECDCVVLPIENSYNGDVGNVLDLAFFGSLYINGVYEAEIIQNLLGVPGAKVDDVQKVISHPQALGQCAAFIEKHGFKKEEAANTAIAAKAIAQMGDKSVAAIGSEEAAEIFGLSVLAPHINESGTNTTRFAVFSRAQRTPAATDDRFIMLFTVKNAAGSLGTAISIIGQHGFNLRALKSRPTKELVWDYFFYVEGEGNINSPQGKDMLCELEECCAHLKVVGTFEKEIHI
ncbi:MAG: chorismate mutase [Ruminococcaceae bacterium]|nr:chorismate mutase [Oscillospiraceae bacterium]